VTISLNTTRSGTSSQCKSSCSSCERPRSNFPVLLRLMFCCHFSYRLIFCGRIFRLPNLRLPFFRYLFRLPFYRCCFCRESKVTELTGYQGIKSFSDRQSRCRFYTGKQFLRFLILLVLCPSVLRPDMMKHVVTFYRATLCLRDIISCRPVSVRSSVCPSQAGIVST